jgi:hypothetical protein
MTVRRGRRRKQLLDVLKEKRRYWKLEEEALDRTMRRTSFGNVYGPVVRQATELINLVNAHFVAPKASNSLNEPTVGVFDVLTAI